MFKLKRSYDVAILGWWYGKNYGSSLTYYALNRVITKLGYKVLMVHEPLGYNGARVKWPDSIWPIQFAKRMGYKFTQQMHYSELFKLNDQVEAFVVGSDQLWNPLIPRVNDDLFLDFVSPNRRRISYSTSFGNKNDKKWKPDFVTKHSKNLKKFDAISVREDYAIEIAKSIFDVKATQTVDPVFLLDSDEYKKLAKKATVKFSESYLLVFFLDPNLNKRKLVEAIAKKLDIRKIVVLPNPDNGLELAQEIFSDNLFEVISVDSPENWLCAYLNSQYIVTDSFHGTAFSIIFEKPFSSIYNNKRGADRFANLLEKLGLGNDVRRVYENTTVEEINSNSNISLSLDYSNVRNRVCIEVYKSKNWLVNSLKLPKKKKFIEQAKAIFKMADLNQPSFISNNDAWEVTRLPRLTRLRISRKDASIKGNHVWCDFPGSLQPGNAYKVIIDWIPRTESRNINIHIRNPKSEKFQVIGTLLKGKVGKRRRDSVNFIVTESEFNQLMFGAIHFTGEEAGADIFGIALEVIPLEKAVERKQLQANFPKGKDPIVVARELSQSDHERYVAAYAVNGVARNIKNSHAILMFHSHGYEKGLSRNKNFRPGFGETTMPKFAYEMNQWMAKGRGTEDPFFKIATSVLRAYFERHRNLGVDVSNFFRLFSPAVQVKIKNADEEIGGVLAARSIREIPIDQRKERNFIDVVYARRSVREFTSEKVNSADIQHAVQIAIQAPSVCNRQPVRVYDFDDPKLIKAALELQGGFKGYAPPPKLLLVTSDLSAFVFAAERNQAFIDGGLFMMLLLLGLEQVGLGACPLNTAMGKDREDATRRLLSISDSEVFVAFIAVGHFDAKTLIPRSKRLPLKEVFAHHANKSI